MSLIARRKIWTFFESLYKNQLDETSPRIPNQPEWIRTPLLAHQQTALQAALNHENSKTGVQVDPLPGEESGGTMYCQYGILGDRVGSGKSLIALSMVKYPPASSQYIEYIQRYAGGNDNMVGLLRNRDQVFSSYPGLQLRTVNTALFIVPHALIGQWEEYVKNDTTLSTYFIKKRKDAGKEDLFEKLDSYDALFVSSTMWREFTAMQNVHTILWSRLFIDEADSISVQLDSDSLFARFYWLISASWMNLIFAGGSYLNIESNTPPLTTTPPYVSEAIRKYRIGDYLNIEGFRNQFIRRIVGNTMVSYNTSFLNPVVFQSTRALIHNKEAFIRQSFNVTDIHHQRILCLAPPNIQILHNMISADMMERLNAGDSEGALEMLGMQAKTAEQVIQAVTDSTQKELDALKHLYEYKKTVEYSSEGARRKAIEQIEEKMARLQSRIEAIQTRLNNTADETCPICFCEVSTPAITPCCRNLFCFACICQVLKHSSVCPLCRELIYNVQSIQVLGTDSEKKEEKETAVVSRPKTKQETFREFLKLNPQAKVLMFSGYDATFQGLSAMLETEGISHTTLNGSQARITKVLNDFEKGKYRVLFLNARNMGAGLNITPATHVVLYHKMAIEMQNQIIGRAMRMGRKDSLTVLHLLHGNEMEMGSEDVIEHV